MKRSYLVSGVVVIPLKEGNAVHPYVELIVAEHVDAAASELVRFLAEDPEYQFECSLLSIEVRILYKQQAEYLAENAIPEPEPEAVRPKLSVVPTEA